MFGEGEKSPRDGGYGGFHLQNFHNKRFEPLTQSSLSQYTTQSDGGRYGKRQHFQFGQVKNFVIDIFLLQEIQQCLF